VLEHQLSGRGGGQPLKLLGPAVDSCEAGDRSLDPEDSACDDAVGAIQVDFDTLLMFQSSHLPQFDRWKAVL
jgi:hypothetical protein